MKIYDILAFNCELLHKIELSGARLEDYKYIPLCNDFKVAKERKEKITYIVAILAEKYCVSERQVYSIIARFDKECKSISAS